ncbi:unnamed protein product [Bursaphelenchus xylophilus]|uniref:(pine wood nematode) hypothetical protein n=1 Tax=Bursaphelenchus xylophilus TaxID=6326 RepID=A0A1I7SJF6_BURXY|nr:unnamed protein product [Bursaphelenchus xylophilus]CAG9086815.1 unnamed protein product [Bursaphelenchus xylophilus]
MRICLDESELIPSICIVQSTLIIMDNIRFDTSLMTRIFLMLYLEASDFWTKNGVIKKQKDVKRNFQMTGNFN